MARKVKVSDVMKAFKPSPPPEPILAFQASKKVAEKKAEAEAQDKFLEGYITAFLEQGYNYSHILNKCSEKGYDVSRKTIDEFMKAVKQKSNINRPSSRKSSDSDDNSSEDSDIPKHHGS